MRGLRQNYNFVSNKCLKMPPHVVVIDALLPQFQLPLMLFRPKTIDEGSMQAWNLKNKKKEKEEQDEVEWKEDCGKDTYTKPFFQTM